MLQVFVCQCCKCLFVNIASVCVSMLQVFVCQYCKCLCVNVASVCVSMLQVFVCQCCKCLCVNVASVCVSMLQVFVCQCCKYLCVFRANLEHPVLHLQTTLDYDTFFTFTGKTVDMWRIQHLYHIQTSVGWVIFTRYLATKALTQIVFILNFICYETADSVFRKGKKKRFKYNKNIYLKNNLILFSSKGKLLFKISTCSIIYCMIHDRQV